MLKSRSFYFSVFLWLRSLLGKMGRWVLPVVIAFIVLQATSFSSIEDFKEKAGSRTPEQDQLHQVHNHEVHCSRERSRAAWKIVDEYLMPFVEEQNYNIPTKCRLHADNDMFREQEQHKIHMDVNDWRCGFCKKSFRAEKFLDKHFDNRHYNLLNANHGRCLADLCGALHCDRMFDSKLPKTKCNPAAAARNRHLCENLADSCFPIHEGLQASRLHEFFLRQFCDAHTCTGAQKPFSRGGKRQSSLLYLVFSILCLMGLAVFYVIFYLYRREMKRTVKDLRRISRTDRKPKPS